MHYNRRNPINSFLPLSEPLFFSSCHQCPAQCCDGRQGSVYAQIILSDFEKIYQNFAILFTFGELGYLKPVVLFNNGKEHCIFNENYQCTIYDKRPSICRVYPLSGNLDNQIYVDHNCPAISEQGMALIENSKINSAFYDDILDDYQDKYIQTHRELEPFNQGKDFELVATIHLEKFYKYIGSQQSIYMQMHQESLKNLKKYNLL